MTNNTTTDPQMAWTLPLQPTPLDPAQFERTLLKLLNAPRGDDYCINGLQVDGGTPITRVVGAVTISDDVIEAAANNHAQAIVVHHGWNWKGEDSRIIGPRAKMVNKLIKYGISLYAFHQPLDQSPDFGNNIALCLALGLEPVVNERGQLETLCQGSVLRCKVPDNLTREASEIQRTYEHAVRSVSNDMKLAHSDLRPATQRIDMTLLNGSKPVKSVAICTGGAQRLFHDLQKLSDRLTPDMYITGEISLPQFYLAKETGMAYLAGGHHHSEIFGIVALMKELRKQSITQSLFFNDWCTV